MRRALMRCWIDIGMEKRSRRRIFVCRSRGLMVLSGGASSPLEEWSSSWTHCFLLIFLLCARAK
jgi:hypothetical protein